ncbi:MAG TPA: AraC family transcriptional regulator [Clostridium sp.]|uniref:AraC family transcriptional regulator n=1 Tax=Clostridium sp. TaxID=1506 RepID=UPI002F9473EA
MNSNNLFFHLHYCNGRTSSDGLKQSIKLNRILQHHELIFITEGKGHVIVQNKKYQFKEGSLIYICPDLQYIVESESEESISCFTVHFSYATVGFNGAKWNITKETGRLELDYVQVLKDYYKINNIFKKLVNSWMNKLPGYEFITKILLQQLLFEIFTNLKKNNRNYSTSLKVEKIIEYMRLNIHTRLTLANLSELVQLSPTYLSTIFKETTGYSVIKFFNKIKVDKAKELIIEGDKKVKEVAQILGFIDEFYFSRIFKKIEGESPSEFYRKNVHGY